MQGANTSLDGCTVGVNSTNTNAAQIAGTSTLSAECLSVAGGVSGVSKLTLACGSPITAAPVIRDPYEDLEPPDLTAYPTCKTPTSTGGDDFALTPGRYCAKVNIKGKMTLAPGTYIIDGVEFGLKGTSARIEGDGVTFILMNGGDLLGINGAAILDMTAPTTGPYSGVLVFADPDSTATNSTLKFLGKDNSTIEGLIYAPHQYVEFGGNAVTSNGCTLVVAKQVDLKGQASFSSDDCRSVYGLGRPGNFDTYIVE
jgi:hypothetical protein